MPDSFPHGVEELTDDARTLLNELDREIPGAATVAPHCRPALDVLETASAIEVVVDVPGVAAATIRVAVRRNTLLIAGAKPGEAAEPASRYHLAERSYGRFARAVRLGGAFDATRARATLRAGQLRVVLPRLEDRRGRVFTIPVDSE
jgi:HSP20 family protein